MGLETRSDDAATRQAVAPLDHPPTHAAVLAERAMLVVLQGGCLAPIAAFGRIEGEQLLLTGRVISHEGAKSLEVTDGLPLPSPFGSGAAGEGGATTQWQDAASIAVYLGRQVAESLLAQGAGELIDAARNV